MDTNVYSHPQLLAVRKIENKERRQMLDFRNDISPTLYWIQWTVHEWGDEEPGCLAAVDWWKMQRQFHQSIILESECLIEDVIDGLWSTRFYVKNLLASKWREGIEGGGIVWITKLQIWTTKFMVTLTQGEAYNRQVVCGNLLCGCRGWVD